ncbi:hypothetical protein [Cohnella yongneupensis]|uniref:Amino acid transporter n=1 Tax=Cohnella yongneupensis TaxID=425006 RepID=A0ABW0R1V7_9BACL
MKDAREDDEKAVINETKPFNDVTEHYQNIMGMPNKPADLSSMPKAVRWFGYFFIGMAVVCFLLMVIGVLKDKF